MKGRARNLPDPDQQKITQALQAAYQTSGWQGMLLEQIRGFEDSKTEGQEHRISSARNFTVKPGTRIRRSNALRNRIKHASRG
jgi:hypothetical protein